MPLTIFAVHRSRHIRGSVERVDQRHHRLGDGAAEKSKRAPDEVSGKRRNELVESGRQRPARACVKLGARRQLGLKRATDSRRVDHGERKETESREEEWEGVSRRRMWLGLNRERGTRSSSSPRCRRRSGRSNANRTDTLQNTADSTPVVTEQCKAIGVTRL